MNGRLCGAIFGFVDSIQARSQLLLPCHDPKGLVTRTKIAALGELSVLFPLALASPTTILTRAFISVKSGCLNYLMLCMKTKANDAKSNSQFTLQTESIIQGVNSTL